MCKQWNAMECALERSVAGAAAESWKRLAAEAPELTGFDDGKALVAHLHGQNGSDAERDRILSALVHASRARSPSGNLARDLIWLALWPGLTALRHRLCGWGVEDEDELGAQITSTFADVLNRLEPTASMKVAATLLWNTRKYVSRALQDGVAARGMEVRLHVDALMNVSGTTDTDWTELISELVMKAGPDAELVLACVVEGLTMREAAARCQLPTDTVKKRLQRVLRRMRANVSANSARSNVPFSRKKELIGGEKTKRGGGGQRDEAVARRSANPETTHVLDTVKCAPARSTRPRSPQRKFRTTRNYLRRVRRFCKSECKAHGTRGGDDMKGPTLPVAVLVAPANERVLSSAEKVVAYCDVCRRWGERGTIHVCGENWSEHLLSVLATTGRSR